MSQTYYTQTIASNGSGLALSDATAAGSPYIVYNANTELNLNFLFREVLFCDPESLAAGIGDSLTGDEKVHIVNCFATDAAAQGVADDVRVSDTPNGSCLTLRLVNAMTNNSKISKDGIDSGSWMDSILNGLYGGYMQGSNGTSSNTADHTTATMDFLEFLQVALSAVRNAETDASTTANNGLVDRETINNAALNDDFDSRNSGNATASSLLSAMMNSANQSQTYADGSDITATSAVNWMKQLVYSIIVQSSNGGGFGQSEANERFRAIRRMGLPQNQQERFLQMKLQDGDSLVFVFNFTLTKDDGSQVPNDQPDNAGSPITIGFKVTHSDSAPDFSDTLEKTGKPAGEGTLPVGWEESV